MSTPETTRFAPSPTGRLHLGHALAAFVAHDLARASGGRLVLRIEDIDTPRCRPEFEAAILEDLTWLGLQWDGPVVRQSERLDAYRTRLSQLETLGVVYPCFCTRRDIAAEVARMAAAPQGPEGPLYPGTCRHLTETERRARAASGSVPALRLDVTRALRLVGTQLTITETGIGAGIIECQPHRLGDVVIARRDVGVAYHLAVVVDDAGQGVTLVTRGVDLAPAAHVQRLLQALLGLPATRYHHHGLVVDAAGRRLAKRDDAESLDALRRNGRSAADIRALAFDRVIA